MTIDGLDWEDLKRIEGWGTFSIFQHGRMGDSDIELLARIRDALESSEPGPYAPPHCPKCGFHHSEGPCVKSEAVK